MTDIFLSVPKLLVMALLWLLVCSAIKPAPIAITTSIPMWLPWQWIMQMECQLQLQMNGYGHSYRGSPPSALVIPTPSFLRCLCLSNTFPGGTTTIHYDLSVWVAFQVPSSGFWIVNQNECCVWPGSHPQILVGIEEVLPGGNGEW